VIIRVNPWLFNYSFKSYLVDGSQRMLCGSLPITSFLKKVPGTVFGSPVLCGAFFGAIFGARHHFFRVWFELADAGLKMVPGTVFC